MDFQSFFIDYTKLGGLVGSTKLGGLVLDQFSYVERTHL